MDLLKLQMVRALALAMILWPCAQTCAAKEPSVTPPSETVLFPFDDYGLPFTKGLVLTLVPGHKSATGPTNGVDPDHPGTPVMPIGNEGDPDFPRAYFCGTILYVDGEFRMWYSGFDGVQRQVCYATSKDGAKWVKPKLGI